MKNLKKTIAILAAALVPLSAAAQVRMNLADGYPPTEFINVNVQRWIDEVRQTANVQIQPHYAGSLFKNPDIKRAVQTGQVELGTQLMQNLGPEKRLFEVDGIPFLVRNYDEGEKLWEISRPYLERHMASQGLRLLFAVPWPSQGFFFRREVNSLADLRGLRQRAYNEMTANLARLMNTVPTTVQITELPQAMNTGTIQCFNTSPTSGVVFKVWEFSSHYYDTDAWLPKNMTFINEAAFQRLPAAAQQAMLAAARTAEQRGWKMSRDNVDAAKKTLADNGMRVLKPSPALAAELAKIGETMRNDWLAKADDDAKAVITQFLRATGR